MQSSMRVAAMAIALGWATGWTTIAAAQAPADAPAGTSGVCNDGTYTQAEHKRGACRGHQGVKQWYSAAGSSGSGASTPSAPPAPAAAPAAAPAPAAASAAPAAPTAPASSKSPSPSAPPAMAAPGGGAGMVWLNSSSNVYHCQGDRWYGKTKHGAYMSEADAKAKGARPDHNKPCGS